MVRLPLLGDPRYGRSYYEQSESLSQWESTLTSRLVEAGLMRQDMSILDEHLGALEARGLLLYMLQSLSEPLYSEAGHGSQWPEDFLIAVEALMSV